MRSINIDVNYIAVLLAAISSMALGYVWYSPILFAKPWMKEMGVTGESMKAAQKKMGMSYGLSFVLSLITAYVLAHVMILSMHYFMYSALTTGLTSAFWMWLGFIMPTQVTGTIFGDHKWNLLYINTGFQLASILIMGLVLGFLGY